MGLLNIIVQSFPDRISALFKFCSAIGPNINPKIKGVEGKACFLMKYPKSPKAIATPTSYKLFLMAKDPIIANINIIGISIFFGTSNMYGAIKVDMNPVINIRN